jgi:hypothetical protein
MDLITPSALMEEESPRRCPRCASRFITRSATRWWERPRRWLSERRPYRCHSCSWRGWLKLIHEPRMASANDVPPDFESYPMLDLTIQPETLQRADSR